MASALGSAAALVSTILIGAAYGGIQVKTNNKIATAQPESKVSAHPIKIAAGDWTVATGTLPGNLTMLTLARWEDGRMAEEYLFLQGPPAPMMMNQTGDSQ
jgi:hypothetical protein